MHKRKILRGLGWRELLKDGKSAFDMLFSNFIWSRGLIRWLLACRFWNMRIKKFSRIKITRIFICSYLEEQIFFPLKHFFRVEI